MNRPSRLGAAAFAFVALAACGGDDTADPTGSASTPGGAGTSAPTAGGDVVEIKALKSLKFDPDKLTATVGTEFRGRLVQEGSIPHDLQIEEFGVKPDDTRVTRHAEAKTFSFTPDKPGTFTFVCTIHPATMKGTLTVT